MTIPISTHRKAGIYTQRVRPASVNIGNAPQQSAPLNVANNPNSTMVQGLMKASGSLVEGYLGKQKAAEQEALKLQEAQQAADILDETTKYYDTVRQYEKEYQDKFKRNDARNALQDWNEFHTKQIQERGNRFKDNPQSNLMWQRYASQIREGSLNRASGYAQREDLQYRNGVGKSLEATFFQRVGEHAMDDAAIEHLRSKFNTEYTALNLGDATAKMAEVDLGVATTRIRTALANDEPAEAKKLMNAYKGVLGKSFDEISQMVNDAEKSHKSFKISTHIRKTMPYAILDDKLNEVERLAKGDKDIMRAATRDVTAIHNGERKRQKEYQDTMIDNYQAKILQAQTEGVDSLQRVSLEITADPNLEQATRTRLLKAAHTGIQVPLVSDQKKKDEVNRLIRERKLTLQELERDYTQHLSKSDMKFAKKKLTDKASARVNEFLLQMEQQTDILFPDLTSGGKKWKVKKELLLNKMDQFVDSYEAENGAMPSNKELDEHKKWLLEQVVYDKIPILGDKKTERLMIESIKIEQFDIDDIPKEVKKQITEQLKANGKLVTNDNIVVVYKRFLSKRDKQ